MGNAKDTLYILIQLSLGGDGRTRAFTRLWHAYGKNVSFYISRFIGGKNMHHEDLFQEVMIKIYEALDRYDTRCALSTWIYRIARNHCIDYLKTRRETIPLTTGGGEASRAADRPDERLLNDELITVIERCIETLDPEDGQIAFLRFYERMKYGEISLVMGINENTIKTRIRAIRSILHHELRDYR